MATITAPSGNVYVFDEVLFQISNVTKACTITVGGVTVTLSPVNGRASFDASGILLKLFSRTALLNGSTQKSISWSAKEDGVAISSGTFNAVYGSKQTPTLIGEEGKTLNLRWIDRGGISQVATFHLHNKETSINNSQTAEVDGAKQVLYSEKETSITVYAPLVDQETFDSYTHIQDSYVVAVETSDGWMPVEVVTKKYKNTFKALQDFDITIKLPSKQ